MTLTTITAALRTALSRVLLFGAARVEPAAPAPVLPVGVMVEVDSAAVRLDNADAASRIAGCVGTVRSIHNGGVVLLVESTSGSHAYVRADQVSVVR